MNPLSAPARENLPALEIESTTILHSERVYCVAFSPDGKTLASGSVNRQVNLWQVGETELSNYLKGHTKFVWSLAFAPDGRTLASTSGDGNLFIWDLEKRAYCRIEESHYSIVYPLYDVACSPDGKYIAAGCSDSLVRLWSTTSRRPPWKLKGHTSEVYAVAFSPDGRILASGGNDATIRFWDLAGKQETELLSRPGSRIAALDFSPDGRYLAAASTNAEIYLIDLGSHQSRTLKGHEGVVWSVAFAPDSRRLISGGNDHTVRLWEVADGGLIQTLEGHLDEVNDVAFSPDGRLAASAANDRTVRVWDLTPFEEQPQSHLHLVRREAARMIDDRLVDFIRSQRQSFRQVRTGNGNPARSLAWLKPALAREFPPPLGLVHDLGRVLTRPAAELPDLPAPEESAGKNPGKEYEALLAELSRSGLREEIAELRLSDRELGTLLDHCLAGLACEPRPAAPADQPAARIIRLLEATLTGNEPEKAAATGSTSKTSPFLPPDQIERLRRRLLKLNRGSIRLLLDLAAAENPVSAGAELFSRLPEESLPPKLGELYCEILARTPKTAFADHRGSQTAAAGGYQGLTHKGDLDSLSLSEHLYPEALLRHRILNREALYYGREAERPRRRRLNLVLLQAGLETRGTARELGRALALCVMQQLVNQPGELRFAFCDGPWTKTPERIDKATLLPRLLSGPENPESDRENFLRRLLAELVEWGKSFPEIEVVWILEGHFWAEISEDEKLSPILAKIGRQAGHRTWYFSHQHSGGTAPGPDFMQTALVFHHVDGQLELR
jgi:WD40 repeat protein